MSAENLTNKRVLQIALPIVISNATVPILGAVDTGVVGQLGEAAPIGAVGIGAIILSALYWIFGFLRMGTVGLTSQAHGAGDRREVAALLTRSILIGVVGGVGIILLQAPLFFGAFMVSPASDEVEGLARSYMAIRVWSAPAAIAIYGITGWLIAQERTRSVLVIQLLMNLSNIALDLAFVIGLGWGVEGVALATLIAEWSGLAIGLWLCRDVLRGPEWKAWVRVFDVSKLRHMATVNGDILIRSVLLQAIFVSFLFFGARFGDVNLAANQILLQFLYIAAYALDGFAAAAETLVGQAKGRRDRSALRRSAVLTSAWGLAICSVLSVVFFLAGGKVIAIMTTELSVREAANSYLIYMVLAPLIGVASWMLDGIFIGATQTRDMRNMMIVSTLAYFPAAILLMQLSENHGLWLALLISFAMRGATLGLRYPALERSASLKN